MVADEARACICIFVDDPTQIGWVLCLCVCLHRPFKHGLILGNNDAEITVLFHRY